MKVTAGLCGKAEPLGRVKGMGGSWAGRVNEVGQRGKDRLAKEDMCSPGIGKDGRRSNRT